MRISSVLLICVLIEACFGLQEDRDAIKACSEENSFTFRTLNDYAEALPAGSPAVQSFFECYLKRLGLVDNGTILYDAIKKAPPFGIATKTYATLVDECKNEKGNSTTETCYKFSICILLKVHETMKQLRQEQFQKQQRSIKVCAEKYKLPIETHLDFLRAFSVGGDKINLFCVCYLQELGYLGSNEKILFEKVKEEPFHKIRYYEYTSIVDKCKRQKGNDTTETCYKFSNCLLSNVNKIYQRNRYLRNEQIQKQLDSIKQCAEKYRLPIDTHEEFVSALSAGGEQMQLLSECFFEKLGYLNSNGTILFEEVSKIPFPKIPYDEYVAFVKGCKSQKGNSAVETCYKFSNCLFSNVHKIYQGVKELRQVKLQKRLHGIKVCAEKYKLPIETEENLVNAIVAGGEHMQSFSECYLRELDYLDSNGMILYQEVKITPFSKVLSDEYIAFVDECKFLRGNSTSETCYKFSKCLFSNIDKVYRNIKESRPEQLQKQLQSMKICTEKYKLHIKTHEDYIKTVLAGEQKMELFSTCYLQVLGYLNSNGVILYQEVKKVPFPAIPYIEYSTFVDECKNEKGNTTTETCHKFMNCLLSNVNEVYQHQRQQLRQKHIEKQLNVIKECSDIWNLKIKTHCQYIKALLVGGVKIQSFSECFLKKQGYLHENGTILFEDVKTAPFPRVIHNEYSTLVDKCKNKNGTTATERCYNFLNCLASYLKKKC
ncbi:hypothetical protein FQA39_LY13678 [Lamprigera yunnana]|nr:hypothetical protein FQA39_LY13678 [Lamprigera yunnana]